MEGEQICEKILQKIASSALRKSETLWTRHGCLSLGMMEGPPWRALRFTDLAQTSLRAPLPVVDNNRKVVGALSVVGEKFSKILAKSAKLSSLQRA